MKKIVSIFAALFFAVSAPSLANADMKKDAVVIKVENIEISNPWTRATPANAQAGAGYMTIKNTGETEDVLISARSNISETVELHEMSMSNDVMTMRPVNGGIVIAPGSEVEFKPGGLHVMFIGLKEPLVKGEKVDVTLVFANAGEVDLSLKISDIGAMKKHKH